MVNDAKICLVGPPMSGKTYLCKLLAETAGQVNQYETTAGCRIQELDRKIGSERVNVQIWDCSGSPQYQACLPAFAKDVNGLVMVYNCEKDDQEAELEKWYQALSSAGMGNLVTSLVRIIAIKMSPGPARREYSMQGKMKKLHHTTLVLPPNPADAHEGATQALQELDKLAEAIIVRRKEKEEHSILEGQGGADYAQ
mmetsp:Transcript_34446/g.47732  ORF Transcript_34446/g.47732 Transcript_34446/m.47732 type:complete len:197 (-) Transcript_34446:212-802(-)|eukprot:CAMPEP_0196585064 /NCGR_PEP_ID=MMETSP1081-20130531/49436_1 /TAXON_ID=36882 /ORGANISM="Pyramimonas amylifera, Strain CCMP720" /LENGTH=196 /DNA_ID=CAMNT_0041906493 /DNA_START=82 /DNA_END=672 /DNA_ORIENTATION=+